jgi:prepilin-type N-terminal cleavage/methylation domain-containing protein
VGKENQLAIMYRLMLINQKGFTLVEIISVLIILSVLAAIAVPKFINLDIHAKEHGIEAGIGELNGQESLVWANAKLAPNGWQDDTQVFSLINPDLGPDYSWTVGPNAGGGTLTFQSSAEAELLRDPSLSDKPARWSRK